MAKIDRVENLPEWFDLSKYERAKSLGPVGWYLELKRRKATLSGSAYVKGKVAPNSKPADWEWHKMRTAQPIREQPLLPEGSEESYGFSVDVRPVSSMRMIDLALQASRDAHIDKQDGKDFGLSHRWKVIADPAQSLPIELADLPVQIDHHQASGVKTGIWVDLSASDALLKEAFSLWLREAREAEQTLNRKPRTPLYDRWARYGLLPYLDLLTWSMETSTHIPDRVMSAAISRYDYGEANLRKTIAPLAAELMRDLSGLRALAAVETAEPETFED